MARRRQGSKRSSGRGFIGRLRNWLLRHAQTALASLGRITTNPLSTLMTITVIGIALALPTGLYVVLDHAQTVSKNWEDGASISLFLKAQVSNEEAEKLAKRLRQQKDIASIRFISKQQAMEEFRHFSGFAGALESLVENPLPPVLIIDPEEAFSAPESVQALLSRLQQLDEADFAQLDLQWLKRFQAIMEIADRGVVVLASLLGLAVLLIVGNTIRLEIQHRHSEIEITKLIGGTDAFIRRPFLYSGLWYGLFGGLVAWFLIWLSLALLIEPVEQLAHLYRSDFALYTPSFSTAMLLLLGSSILGLGGSWVAVGRHLSQIEPT